MQYRESKLNSLFQVERKRHIGNDIVNIIFMDGSPEDAAKFQACSIALSLPIFFVDFCSFNLFIVHSSLVDYLAHVKKIRALYITKGPFFSENSMGLKKNMPNHYLKHEFWNEL